MRWIDRGPEPATVAGYDQQFTAGWIEHYRQNRGQEPADSFWREFRPVLGDRSGDVCWYCERHCAAAVGEQSPTVDHFRPRRWFPELTYRWSNWVFSCERCNFRKGGKWPETGYGNNTGYGFVDPGAADPAERPAHYFDYEENTGKIVPRNDLSGPDERRAADTIRDLGLNDWDLLILRSDWLEEFKENLLSLPASEQGAFIAAFVESPVEYAGVAGMLVEQLRQAGRLSA